jgi:hypothetical protein
MDGVASSDPAGPHRLLQARQRLVSEGGSDGKVRDLCLARSLEGVPDLAEDAGGIHLGHGVLDQLGPSMLSAMAWSGPALRMREASR